jgi:hypothetical protein
VLGGGPALAAEPGEPEQGRAGAAAAPAEGAVQALEGRRSSTKSSKPPAETASSRLAVLLSTAAGVFALFLAVFLFGPWSRAAALLDLVRERPTAVQRFITRLSSMRAATGRALARSHWDRPGRPRAELYAEARRLGIAGRSRMDRSELAAAIRAKRHAMWSVGATAGLLAWFRNLDTGLVRGFTRFRNVDTGLVRGFLLRPRPVRLLVLSVAALAAGGLGLMVAYAITPEENLGGEVLVTNGSRVRIATVTGPGGTTTVAVTKTREGKTKLVPIRVLRTVTGPGGTRTVAVNVLGPPVTQVVTDVATQTRAITNVVTETQPVTLVVTDVITQVDTVTVVSTETVTVINSGP